MFEYNVLKEKNNTTYILNLIYREGPYRSPRMYKNIIQSYKLTISHALLLLILDNKNVEPDINSS